MTKKKPRYESRVFDGRIIHSDEFERIHTEVREYKSIEAISNQHERAERQPYRNCPKMALAISVPRETAALQAQMPCGLLVPDAQ